MQGVLDILQVVARRGPLSFDALETTVEPNMDGGDSFGYSLDVCIDDGLLCRVWTRGAPLDQDDYRLTKRGLAFLRSGAVLAA